MEIREEIGQKLADILGYIRYDPNQLENYIEEAVEVIKKYDEER